MRRNIYEDLLKWKSRADRKPLVLLGARQVGKTYILKDFGKNEFAQTIYINCQRDTFAAQLFRDFDVKRILREIERNFETTIVDGDTILVLDEIQEAKGGLTALKYFNEEKPNLHVAAAGSLLGITLRENESYPVGKVNILQLFPMTFDEYLLARGRLQLVEMLKDLKWDEISAFHEQLTDYLREYYFVGGMPEAVLSYATRSDIKLVREIQNNILDAYLRDIAKHTRPQVQRIRQLWESVPIQLARENKKFIFGAVRKGSRAADYEIAIQWLIDAGLLHKVQRIKEPTAPLKFYCDYSAFKLYMLDCGLLACLSGAEPRDILLGDNAFKGFKGAFSENYVLQQLLASGIREVYYFSKDNSSMEVDFIYRQNGHIIPIEVKAETNVKSKSLANFIKVDYADEKLKGIRVSMLPHIDQGWVENVPLYAIGAFAMREDLPTD